MKKISMIMAAVAVSASVCAQSTENAQSTPGTAIVPNSAGDNIYIGANFGASAPLKGYKFMSNLTPEFGLRIVKNFGTVFGVGIDANMHFASTPDDYVLDGKTYKLDTKTFVDNTNISLIGTANLSNMFGGYKGEPRCFEVIGLGGFGWGHRFGNSELEALTSKVGLDFAVNLGKEKAVQVYAEPSITWDLLGSMEVLNALDCHNDRAHFTFKVGVNYKFKNSNGKHNFTIEQLRDQSEIDALNARINDLRTTISANESRMSRALSEKDAEIFRLKKELEECQTKPTTVVEQVVKQTANLQPTVVFGQGKSAVEKSQEANISLIANYMKKHPEAKVKILGYASPEGNPELNQKLSEARANAVKDVLVKKYRISADRLETEGLGATDKLFDEVEFNRVATFTDLNK